MSHRPTPRTDAAIIKARELKEGEWAALEVGLDEGMVPAPFARELEHLLDTVVLQYEDSQRMRAKLTEELSKTKEKLAAAELRLAEYRCR